MSAVGLLKNNASPNNEEIDAAMSGNVCRCATYFRIRDAIKLASQRFKLAYSNIRGSINASPSRAFLYRQNVVPGNDSMRIVKAIIEGKLDWRYWRDRQKAHTQFS